MKVLSRFRLWLPLAGIALFLCFPDRARAGVLAGLELSGAVLIPALFPVSVLAGCLIRMAPWNGASSRTEAWMRRLFGLPGSAALPLLLGLLGGFPLGAHLAATAQETGQLSKREAARLAGLSCCAGPAFLLGALGGLLGVYGLGPVLLVIQLGSGLLAGLLHAEPSMPVRVQKTGQNAPPPSFGAVLPRCIADSAGAMLRLAGTVAFFQAASACLLDLIPLPALPPLRRAGVSGALELTGGLALLRGLPQAQILPAAAAMIGWGGLCVHLQAAEALSRAEIPLGPYLRHKAIQAGISLLLALPVRALLFGVLSPVDLAAGAILVALFLTAIFRIRKKSVGNSQSACYNEKKISGGKLCCFGRKSKNPAPAAPAPANPATGA